MKNKSSDRMLEGVEQCDRVGNFGRCELAKGHDGVHHNKDEQFIQFDVTDEMREALLRDGDA